MDTVTSHRVQILTLRPFQIVVDGEPLRIAGRGQHKPLLLLKVLVALGGENVAEQVLTDSLWPDSDGDAAHHSFATTLYRLRQLLGLETLRLSDGRISLVREHCSLDLWDFAASASRIDRATPSSSLESLRQAARQILDLYRAPFLEGEFEPPETLSARERLHSQFLRVIQLSAERLQSAADLDGAAAILERALEADDESDALYRQLMSCQLAQSRIAEGLALYDRCRAVLKAKAGIEPSAETEAVRNALSEARAGQWDRTMPSDAPRAESHAPLPALSLAVLPLTNMSGDPTLDYFSDGLAEDLITDLSQYKQLAVVARNSSFKYKGKSVDVREIGRDLGARYILEGSVRQSENRDHIRVTLQLANAESGSHVWAERYDRPLENVFTLQVEIVDKVAVAIDIKLMAGEQSGGRRHSTHSYEAYKLLRRAIEENEQHTRESVREAARLSERAAAIDPNFAGAWSAIGVSHFNAYLYRLGDNPRSSLEQAEKYARKALFIDSRPVEPRILLACVLACRQHHAEALAIVDEVVASEPANASAVLTRSWILLMDNRPGESLAENEKAIRLRPSPEAGYYNVRGITKMVLRRDIESVKDFENATKLAPGWAEPHMLLIAALQRSGATDEARTAARRFLEIEPGFSVEALYPVWEAHRNRVFVGELSAALRAAGLK
jgi:adenylate cyclase